MLIVVGSNDEAFVASEYPAAVAEFSHGEVHIIEGATHNSILENTIAMQEIQRWMANVQPVRQ